MTLYEDIFNRFLRKVVDDKLYEMNEYDRNDQMVGYLDSAVATLRIKRIDLGHDLSKRDNYGLMFEEDLDDYEQEILAIYMAIAWYEPIINSLEHTILFIGSKDERFTPQKEHMNMLVNKQELLKIEARKLIRDYSIMSNDYLEES